MIIGLIKEKDKRTVITNQTINLYKDYKIFAEHGYLEECPNIIFKTKEEIFSYADVLVTICGVDDLSGINNKIKIVELCHLNDSRLKNYSNFGFTVYNLTKLPRVTRSQNMDILSSQANLAGYRAVIEGSYLLNKVFPLMMTSAGTISAARVLVIGAGVAGLQAIATAKRLGAIVSAFDVRSSVKEQVESLGAIFVEIGVVKDEDRSGYANASSKDELTIIQSTLSFVLEKQDLIITTAQVPGQKPPVLITKEMMKLIKKDSIIIDLANGNVESEVNENVYRIPNILDKVSKDASSTLSRNVHAFLNLMRDKGDDDELIFSTKVVSNGVIL